MTLPSSSWIIFLPSCQDASLTRSQAMLDQWGGVGGGMVAENEEQRMSQCLLGKITKKAKMVWKHHLVNT